MGPIPALQLNSFLRYKQNQVNFRPKNGKMTILLQKTGYKVTIIDWNWEKYKMSGNLKQRAFIWDQFQLSNSIHSLDITKTS